MRAKKNNKVIKDFGSEWSRFKNDKNELESALQAQFLAYTSPLKNFTISSSSIAADFGAGSGRWDKYFAPMLKSLTLVEPSEEAISVAQDKLRDFKNINYLCESIEECSLENGSLDLAISLGVLHHTDDTEKALLKISKKLKPRGIFLGYLYYNFENKPHWYRILWKLTDLIRVIFSKLPKFLKISLAELIALLVYYPLSKISLLVEKIGGNSSSIPLHHYSKMPLYFMRNDALDRFGTLVERRFSKNEIKQILSASNFDISTLVFSELEPFWTFAVRKKD